MYEYSFIPFSNYMEYAAEEMKERAVSFRKDMQRRRTIRNFSDRDIPDGVIEECIMAAGTAPNGANLQPWHFVVVKDPAIKKKIRTAAEKEEKEFYDNRASEEWLEDLKALGTDDQKPFLEKAPCLIAIFSKRYGLTESGRKKRHYYVKESVGIATGILITALHHSGLATLTHTPSPMSFLNDILNRPENERPFLLLVVGYPEKNAKVPDIKKKSLSEISTFL
ncbi:MAG: nitroreductase family protein [Balneolaceae bacterium]